MYIEILLYAEKNLSILLNCTTVLCLCAFQQLNLILDSNDYDNVSNEVQTSCNKWLD